MPPTESELTAALYQATREVVSDLFQARPQVFDLPVGEDEAEYDLRLRVMESALAQVDSEPE